MSSVYLTTSPLRTFKLFKKRYDCQEITFGGKVADTGVWRNTWGREGAMETAVFYEMLGKVSNGIYFYSWASEPASGDETLGATGEVLKSEMTES